MFLILGVMITSCQEDEGLTLTDQNTLVPTNVAADFKIAEDDSGTLTVIPTAEGATQFEILFGDDASETSTKIAPGESASHVYAEGDYTLTVTAVGITGAKTSITQSIAIRFAPPENLVVQVSTDNLAVTVTPSATGATLFEVFFGDVPNEEPTTVMPGESVTHVYPELGEYEIRTIARGAGLATVETTNLVQLRPSILLPVDFESPNLTFSFVGFEGANTEVVNNPSANGINTSGKVARTTKDAGSQNFAGSFIDLGEAIDFSSQRSISFDVNSPKAGIVVKLRLEPLEDGGNLGIEVDARTTVANGWETLTYDFSGFDLSTIEFRRMVFFFDFENQGDGSEYFFDNIQQVASEEVALPVNFESNTLNYDFIGFEGANTEIINNPSQNPGNQSAKVARTTKAEGAQFFAGSFIDLGQPIDFSTQKVLSLNVNSPKSGIIVKLRLEPAGGSQSAGIEVDARTTVANEWETLTYDFSGFDLNSTQFVRMVLFFDFENAGDGSSYLFDDIQQVTPESLTLPVNFESSTLSYGFVGFEGANTEIIDNPSASGINTSAKVARTTKDAGAQFFAGSFFDLTAPIDFATFQKISLKVNSPKSDIVVKLRLEPAGGSQSAGIEVDARTMVANEWETLTYDFSNFDLSTTEFVRIVIFFDFENGGDGSQYLFDDIQQIN